MWPELAGCYSGLFMFAVKLKQPSNQRLELAPPVFKGTICL